MKIFLSYPRSHGHIAEDLAARLRADDHEVFIDVSSQKIAMSRFRSTIATNVKVVTIFGSDQTEVFTLCFRAFTHTTGNG